MNCHLFKPVMDRLNEIGANPDDLAPAQWALFFDQGWRLQVEWKDCKNYTEKIIQLIPPKQ